MRSRGLGVRGGGHDTLIGAYLTLWGKTASWTPLTALRWAPCAPFRLHTATGSRRSVDVVTCTWPQPAAPPPPCDIPSGCCSFTGPWTVTRSSLRMSTFCLGIVALRLCAGPGVRLKEWSGGRLEGAGGTVGSGYCRFKMPLGCAGEKRRGWLCRRLGPWGHPPSPPPQGCIRGEGATEAAPEAVRQAVGGGCRIGWWRLLSVNNAMAGTRRQRDSGWV